MAATQGFANIYARRDRLLIASRSLVEGCEPDENGIWCGLTTESFDRYSELLFADRSIETVGRALRAALRASDIGVPAPPAWADGVGSDKRERDARLAAALGLPSPTGLYSGMRICLADWARGEVMLTPTRRLPGGRFAGFEKPWQAEHPDVVAPMTSSDAELGEAVRLCLDRCL